MFQQILQQIEKQLLEEKPFVVYRKPGQKLVKGIFQSDTKIHYCSDFKETGFVFAPFDENDEVILIPLEEVVEAPFELNVKGIHQDNIPPIHDSPSELDERNFHLQLVSKAIKEIEKGTFKKVVLSRQILSAYQGTPLQLFLKLLNTYLDAFCYMWYHPKVGLWLGATPEVLVSIQNKHIQTMSLAGTQPYTGDPNPEWKKKDIEEQSMVTNYITEVLKNMVTQLQISETESSRAGSLMHLRTKITGRLKVFDVKKLLKVLHPTPAVGGMPKNEAYLFIKANENYKREFYTGYLGELNFKEEIVRASNNRNIENQAYRAIHTKTDLFVNLRSMQLVDKTAIIYIGGGITIDSIPEQEWEETVNKSATMLKVIQNRL
ncbi:isochorismate synthase [Sediminicola sp. YIK13]|uniref:chorismate-binding protein n=1 Tax=Sediminicola sp. YIK13 TaxID=1453352 RepID=UPI000721F145|nr:chorismate-binding protein [Sediminicola sp. YIK13]ALM07239.1 isochorismate synthase [Sediminicola sp. YIK13]